jgi:hypothetical protein
VSDRVAHRRPRRQHGPAEREVDAAQRFRRDAQRDERGAEPQRLRLRCRDVMAGGGKIAFDEAPLAAFASSSGVSGEPSLTTITSK